MRYQYQTRLDPTEVSSSRLGFEPSVLSTLSRMTDHRCVWLAWPARVLPGSLVTGIHGISGWAFPRLPARHIRDHMPAELALILLANPTMSSPVLA